MSPDEIINVVNITFDNSEFNMSNHTVLAKRNRKSMILRFVLYRLYWYMGLVWVDRIVKENDPLNEADPNHTNVYYSKELQSNPEYKDDLRTIFFALRLEPPC